MDTVRQQTQEAITKFVTDAGDDECKLTSIVHKRKYETLLVAYTKATGLLIDT